MAVRGMVIIVCALLAGCANKQILRDQAIMTKKLGATATSLEQWAGTSLHDSRVAELMSYTPPQGDDMTAFLTFVCDRDRVGLSVEQSLGIYRRSLAELENLAQGPADGSFATLAASMKKSNKARKDLPHDPAEKAQAMKDARTKAGILTDRAKRRCRSIVTHDLTGGKNQIRGSARDVSAYLALVNFVRAGLTLSEQTMRAKVVRDYTDKVVRPDLHVAYLYLAAEPTSTEPEDKLAAGDFSTELAPRPSWKCSERRDFMNPDKQVPEVADADDKIGFGEAHGRLAMLVAQSRQNAIRTGYIHHAVAKQLKQADPRLPKNPPLDAARDEVILRSTMAAADALARADGLIAMDVDCEVLPKLHKSQQGLMDAVVKGTGTADLADGFADALANLQAILDALDKMKKAGW